MVNKVKKKPYRDQGNMAYTCINKKLEIMIDYYVILMCILVPGGKTLYHYILLFVFITKSSILPDKS